MCINHKLEEFQELIDKNHNSFCYKLYDVKLQFHKSIKKYLDDRDNYLFELNKKEFKDLFKNAIEKFEEIYYFYDYDDIGSLIKFIKAEYCDNYIMKMRIDFYENDYFENSFLEKTIYLDEREPIRTAIKWKDGEKNISLFIAMSDSESRQDLFDTLYEFYNNLSFLMLTE